MRKFVFIAVIAVMAFVVALAFSPPRKPLRDITEAPPDIQYQEALGMIGGEVRQRHENEGLLLVHRAAMAGYGPAQAYLGRVLATGEGGVVQDSLGAYVWLFRAGESGEDVQALLGEVRAKIPDSLMEFVMERAKDPNVKPVAIYENKKP